ncbi:MAG: acyl-CoA dehydrogenase family protein [Fimbriimonadia bacterium]|nr:acyl-CoA dehydrogenase family protein [Fimbriimonadia bacterium]
MSQLTLRGGEFLLREAEPRDTFIYEDFTSEDLLIAQAADEFIRGEVLPKNDAIDHQEEGLAVQLLKKAGELGLLGADLPEMYGGLGLAKMTSTLLAEKMSLQASFAVSTGAHSGIGTLPILFFGTPEQKKKYVPRLATGELVGAFSLSEAGCGSDPLSARTKATLSPDGKHYLLNGEKMWTTNGGWADVFIVFAKIDGEQFSAFIVERGFPGVSVGREEHKLGIKGSSTRRVILENAQVPVENLLHIAGKGHHVAFGVLNIGRFKLAAAGLGGCREALTIATRYAKDRQQFGKSISEFGLIKEKLAEMAIRIFALESAVYRTAGMLNEAFHGIDAGAENANELYHHADEEFPVECAILKVLGSEVLDFVADETVQIHGGFGYTEEFPAAQIYRDSRINRIFEGTNEINRLLMLDQMMKRAMKGKLPGMMEAAQAIRSELNQPMMPSPDPTDPVEQVERHVKNAKKIILMTAGMAVEEVGMQLQEKQEIVARLSDCMIHLFAMESAWLRVRKLQEKGLDATIASAMMQVYAYDAFDAIEASARRAILSFVEGDMRHILLTALKRYARRIEINTMELRRQIAEYVIEHERAWSASGK